MNYKSIISLCLISLLLFTCEKDDICAEGSAITPQLIVTFFDETNPTQRKNVEDLLVFGLDDNNQTVPFQSSTITTTDSIAFPLRTDVNITKIVFWNETFTNDNGTPDDNEDDFTDTVNQDIIDFSYMRSDVYVSRACGFIANYLDLNATLVPDSDNWILNTEIVKENVENEIEAHVKIFH